MRATASWLTAFTHSATDQLQRHQRRHQRRHYRQGNQDIVAVSHICLSRASSKARRGRGVCDTGLYGCDTHHPPADASSLAGLAASLRTPPVTNAEVLIIFIYWSDKTSSKYEKKEKKT